MKITVNGKAAQVMGKITIAGLLQDRALKKNQMIVERNGVIVKANSWEQTVLEPGDHLEIVTFVGGG